jgi:hypothetical protein
MRPLPTIVIATSYACDGSLSPNQAVPAMQPRPPIIRTKIVERRCLRKPIIRAIVPKSATSRARLRWTLSSAGRKCARTAEKEINTGVRRQWTTHSAEVQTPILSAHSLEPPIETRASRVICVRLLKIRPQLQLSSKNRSGPFGRVCLPSLGLTDGVKPARAPAMRRAR